MKQRPEGSLGSRTRHQAFTLVELLFVMGLIGILLGTGVGLLAGLAPAERAVAGLLEETVRMAQRSAAVQSGPAWVRCDLAHQTVSAQVLRTVGTWQFEDVTLAGGGDLPAVWMGGGEVPLSNAGFQGKALDLSGSTGSGQLQISVQDEPAFDWSEGFSVHLALRVDVAKSAILLRMGEGLILALSNQGALGVEFLVRQTNPSGQEARGPRVRIETEPGCFEPGVWRVVEVTYDRRALRIAVDGVVRAQRPEVAQVWMGEPRIWISDKQAPFPGSLDRLVIGVIEDLPPRKLPAEARFHPESAQEIVFAPGGALDLLRHSGPVTLRWILPGGEEESLKVSLQGTVE